MSPRRVWGRRAVNVPAASPSSPVQRGGEDGSPRLPAVGEERVANGGPVPPRWGRRAAGQRGGRSVGVAGGCPGAGVAGGGEGGLTCRSWWSAAARPPPAAAPGSSIRPSRWERGVPDRDPPRTGTPPLPGPTGPPPRAQRRGPIAAFSVRSGRAERGPEPCAAPRSGGSAQHGPGTGLPGGGGERVRGRAGRWGHREQRGDAPRARALCWGHWGDRGLRGHRCRVPGRRRDALRSSWEASVCRVVSCRVVSCRDPPPPTPPPQNHSGRPAPTALRRPNPAPFASSAAPRSGCGAGTRRGGAALGGGRHRTDRR